MCLPLVLLSSLLLVSGCTDSPGPSSAPTPTVAGSTPALTPAPTATGTQIPEERFVPNVKGQQVEDARAHLERRGFRVKVHGLEVSACLEDGRVLHQAPPPRYIRDVGSKVTLTVNTTTGDGCGLDLPRPEPALAGAGNAFVEFARGGNANKVLLNHPVDLYLGGRLVHTIPAWRAVHRNSYGWLCPTSGSYAAAVCPFSAVRALVSYPGPIAVTSQAPSHPCMRAQTFAGTRERTVTLTPDESRACPQYFAVELALGADGRLLAVNLVASEP